MVSRPAANRPVAVTGEDPDVRHMLAVFTLEVATSPWSAGLTVSGSARTCPPSWTLTGPPCHLRRRRAADPCEELPTVVRG